MGKVILYHIQCIIKDRDLINPIYFDLIQSIREIQIRISKKTKALQRNFENFVNKSTAIYFVLMYNPDIYVQ